MRFTETEVIYSIVKRALSEDLADGGDITSQAVFGPQKHAEAVIESKEAGIVSGVYLIEPVFKTVDHSLLCEILTGEGSPVKPGTEICRVKGPICSILAGERLILNFLQRLSGIATMTAHLVLLLQGTKTQLLDTRKTTPLLRILEKKAIVAGGGANHRFGLFDMILIKDTHVKASGGPGPAVRKAKQYCRTHTDIKIEVEVQSVDQFKEACAERPDRVMLDNMSTVDMASCVSFGKTKFPFIEIEASGNITEENIRAVAETGVDFISVGAITHSPKALDIHLKIV